MTHDDSGKFPPKSKVEKRRAETDKVFAEIKEKERAERLAKTMRLRGMRVLNNVDDSRRQ
jgi:hypothetical protein